MKNIILWYILFLSSVLCSIYSLGTSLYEKNISPFCVWETMMLQYENRLQQIPPNIGANQGVIIGPSYGLSLGNFNRFYNLSFPSASRSERNAILRRYSSAGAILYILSTIDIAGGNDKPRLSAIYPFFRRLVIFRTAVRSKMGLVEKEPFPWRKAPTQEELRVISQALDLEKTPDILLQVLLWQIRSFQTTDPNIPALVKIHEENPNVIFVISPHLPMKRVKERSNTANIINKIIDQDILHHRLFLESGLPIIDLSDTLEPRHFQDLYHFTGEGITILQNRILLALEDSQYHD